MDVATTASVAYQGHLYRYRADASGVVRIQPASPGSDAADWSRGQPMTSAIANVVAAATNARRLDLIA